MNSLKESPFVDLPMRMAMGSYKPLTDDILQLMTQLGVSDVLLTPHQHTGFKSVMPLGETWTVEMITEVQSRIESHDMRLYAFEKMPIPLYNVLLDDGDRGEQMDILKNTIRNMGKAGIPVLGYSGHPPKGAVRTSRSVPIRGGAEVSSFDMDEMDDTELLYDRVYEEEEIWTKYEQFLEEIIPVAEQAGVTMGVHPSDPPVESIGGIPLLFRSFKNFKRAMNIVDSENHGLKFCLGCWSEMGEDVTEVLRYFGGEDIIYVHFRDVVGTVPKFREAFLDEPESNYNEYGVMKTLHDIGFDGVMTPDHVPAMTGDTDWEFGGVNGRIYTVGYLRGLLKAVAEEAKP